MALERYEGPGAVYFGSNPLAESTSVSWDVNSNNNPVFTTKKGFAGFSAGATQTQVTVENAVPLAGLEHDYVERCVVKAFVTIVVAFAGKRYAVDGYIDSFGGRQGVDQAAQASFVVMGGAPRIL